jgi:hypothetical protein
MGEKHPLDRRAVLANDVACTLHWHLAHEDQSESLVLLGEKLAAFFPRRCHTVHLAIVATLSPRQRTQRSRTPCCRHSDSATASARHDRSKPTVVPARVLFFGHKSGVSSTFNRKVGELASSRASTTRQVFQSPTNCPNVRSCPIAGHYPVAFKHPSIPLEIAMNLKTSA